MSPFRGDVLLLAALFALPVVALTLRGDLSTQDLTARLPWCLLAGWLVVSVVRFAARPAAPAPARGAAAAEPTPAPEDAG
ncbi:hypothetical protein GB931_16470 [Modestobacter sp. I12A-02628]|uniref:Uncharacterized protein n=1 Tax=Goekera deserti TaxID=2497753 RepID=A0A7K3WGQ2_9ACTN|nr:hypothetical protein [Goekera deserti]MPQ99481.1 hypothetical protein [Goekera deserti]NDI48968.1 hypothetical protein [Goekera deserti]NEL55562.1 hypothetical protein [Goekera deserti]